MVSNKIRFYILWFFYKLYTKHFILYVQCVDLLMWSPTKLKFLFYDFSVIYNIFLKIQLKFFKKEKDKTMVTVANRGYCGETVFKTPGSLGWTFAVWVCELDWRSRVCVPHECCHIANWVKVEPTYKVLASSHSTLSQLINFWLPAIAPSG